MKWNRQMRAQEAACFAGPHIELADHFFRYKLLKAHIKRVVSDPQLDCGDASFKTHLLNEMDRVSKFYTQKEDDYLQVLEKKLVPRTEKMLGPSMNTVPSNSPEDLDVSSIAEKWKDTDYGRLLKDFASLSESVKALKRFALVNALAVIKATKKHDKNMKQFDKAPLQKEMAERLAEQSIVQLPKLSPLQNRLESLVLHIVAKCEGCLADSSQADASDGLHAPALLEESPSPTFAVAPLLFEALLPAASPHCDQSPVATDPAPQEVATRSTGGDGGRGSGGQEGSGVSVQPRVRRRKQGDGGKQALGGKPVDPDTEVDQDPIVVNAALLREYFNLPLADAAHKLGICATAIKKVCRKMGITKWPYKTIKPIERRLQYLREKLASRDGGQEASLREEIELLERRREEQLRSMCNIDGGKTEQAKEEEEEEEEEEEPGTEEAGEQGPSTVHVWGMRVNVAPSEVQRT